MDHFTDFSSPHVVIMWIFDGLIVLGVYQIVWERTDDKFSTIVFGTLIAIPVGLIGLLPAASFTMALYLIAALLGIID